MLLRRVSVCWCGAHKDARTADKNSSPFARYMFAYSVLRFFVLRVK